MIRCPRSFDIVSLLLLDDDDLGLELGLNSHLKIEERYFKELHQHSREDGAV